MNAQSVDVKVQNQAKNSKLELKYRAFYFGLKIIRFLEGLEYRQSIKIISDQLIRCSTSIGANIVEAKGSSSKREFTNYFQISLKSSFEAKYWLALLRELIPTETAKVEELSQELEEISKIISSSVLTLKGKRL